MNITYRKKVPTWARPILESFAFIDDEVRNEDAMDLVFTAVCEIPPPNSKTISGRSISGLHRKIYLIDHTTEICLENPSGYMAFKFWVARHPERFPLSRRGRGTIGCLIDFAIELEPRLDAAYARHCGRF